MLRFNFCWLLLSALLIVSASCGKNQNNALQNESPENSCCSAETEESQNSSRRAVGAPFELKGKTTDGDDFSWDAYKDKFVLIDFTASWCGPCRAEMPNLLDIYAKYHDKGFEIISIGISDKTENLKKQIEEDKITWTMISEELSPKIEGSTLGDYYGVISIPTIFLVGKDGKIIATGLRGAKLSSVVSQLFEKETEVKN